MADNCAGNIIAKRHQFDDFAVLADRRDRHIEQKIVVLSDSEAGGGTVEGRVKGVVGRAGFKRCAEGIKESLADRFGATPFSQGIVGPRDMQVRRNDGNALVERSDDMFGALQLIVRAGTA